MLQTTRTCRLPQELGNLGCNFTPCVRHTSSTPALLAGAAASLLKQDSSSNDYHNYSNVLPFRPKPPVPLRPLFRPSPSFSASVAPHPYSGSSTSQPSSSPQDLDPRSHSFSNSEPSPPSSRASFLPSTSPLLPSKTHSVAPLPIIHSTLPQLQENDPQPWPSELLPSPAAEDTDPSFPPLPVASSPALTAIAGPIERITPSHSTAFEHHFISPWDTPSPLHPEVLISSPTRSNSPTSFTTDSLSPSTLAGPIQTKPTRPIKVKATRGNTKKKPFPTRPNLAATFNHGSKAHPAFTSPCSPLRSYVKADDEPTLDSEQEAVLDFVRRGNSCFFTGAAGTGKSVVLRSMVRALRQKHGHDAVGVTASTGTAAANLKSDATTIHRFADWPKPIKYGGGTRFRDIEVLIIDEVSMLSGSLIQELSDLASIVRGDPRPFGGLQMIFTGDFYQLPPVEQFKQDSAEPDFAFNAPCWNKMIPPENCRFLENPYRQKDPKFANILNRLRFGLLTEEDIAELDKRVTPAEDIPSDCSELVTHRRMAERINEDYLDDTLADCISFEAKDEAIYPALKQAKQQQWPRQLGDKGTHGFFIAEYLKALKDLDDPRSEYASPFAKVLHLKVGVKVMVNQNARPEDAYVDGSALYNGLQGTIRAVHWPESVDVEFDGRRGIVTVRAQVAQVLKTPSGSRNRQPIVRRIQLPLTLSKAITIHKSQGQTLETVKADLERVWERSHVYVALSRAATLDGLYLTYPIKDVDPIALLPWPSVHRFHEQFAKDAIRRKAETHVEADGPTS